MPAPPKSVLIIDDDEMSRDLLALLLTAEGHTVHAEPSGDAALRHLESNPAPGVVLTDMQMPGQTGAALAFALRTSASGARIIAMSGSRPSEKDAAAFDALLLKPFSVADFNAALEPALESAHSAAATNAALNPATFSNLTAAMPQQQLQQLYAICLDDTRKRIARMRAAASKTDDATFRREAHAIKGSCGMLGAAHLQSLAGQMEASGIPNPNAPTVLAEFLKACDELESILKQHFAPSIP